LSSGIFRLKSPWSTPANKVYTVIAIRTFEDIYKGGDDVYQTVYVPNGCTDGTLVDGVAFSFEAERAKKPEVISLYNEVTAEMIYVPTTFILTTPDQNIVKYEHVVLSISLGAIPKSLDLAGLRQDVIDLVRGRVGITSTVELVVMPSSTNPSPDESIAFENARIANITNPGTFQSQLLIAQREKAELQLKITEYERIIRNNNLIP
jgi:hypothetical protein